MRITFLFCFRKKKYFFIIVINPLILSNPIRIRLFGSHCKLKLGKNQSDLN